MRSVNSEISVSNMAGCPDFLQSLRAGANLPRCNGLIIALTTAFCQQKWIYFPIAALAASLPPPRSPRSPPSCCAGQTVYPR
jgi:hypothetical protein